MKTILMASLIFSLSLIFGVEEARGRIIFDWSQAPSVALDTRQEAETRINRVSGEYLFAKYANLGPYDFINSSDEFTVMVMDRYEKENGAKAEYFPGVLGGIIFADPSFLKNMNIFQIGVFHELSHAYDYIMTDRILHDIRFFIKVRKSLGIDYKQVGFWHHQYIQAGEKRAFAKEELYIEDMRQNLSDEEYEAAMRHVTDGKRAHGVED